MGPQLVRLLRPRMMRGSDPPMRRSRTPSATSSDSVDVSAVEPSSDAQPRYPRPKILIIDAPDVAPLLLQRGYAAMSGSFGQPIVVPAGSGYFPVTISRDDLPGYTEQEIIVVDLAGPVARQTDSDARPSMPGPGVNAIWAPLGPGLVDPRPAAMRVVRQDMDRILRHGGVFIIFATARFSPRYIFASLDSDGGINSYYARKLEADNWGILSELQYLPVEDDAGEEMDIAPSGIARILGIESYFSSGRFDCVIKPSDPVAFRWDTLATSKYGDPVAGIMHPDGSDIKGWVFVLPQIQRRAELVLELVDHILPRLVPRLFPHAEGSQWTRRPEYDLPRVAQLRKEIVETEQDARAQIRKREELIEAERAQYGFLHDLLTATGDELVQAVVSALSMIGFNDVQNVDAVTEATGQSGPLREDIRIMDAPKPVLVEVKGISGMPREASALQVTKYLIPRMREWHRTDIHGLAIINHQKHLPALDREHAHVFQ